MKIRIKKIKIIAITTILVITIIYGIWKENKGKIKIENINEQAEITDIEDNKKTKNLHNTTIENNENIKNKETNKTDKNKIVIYIIGEVKQEGVYELDEDSRISDAIEKAGGTKENADLSQINLAYKIEDGMRIYIPQKGELIQDKEKIEDKTQEIVTGKSTDITTSIQVNANSNSSTNKNSKTNIEKININKATQTELETLPGVGPSTAEKIIAYRKQNGNFKNIEDIMNVNGIGESKYNKIKDLISV